MKKTKILRILLSLSVGALALSATACDKMENFFSKHEHSFGEWTEYTDEGTACDKKLFFRTCSTCKDIEWEQGTADDHNWNTVTTAPTCTEQGYDTKTCTICGEEKIENYTPIQHTWAEEYVFDNSYHWIDCSLCEESKDKAEHTLDDVGLCSVCNPIGDTEGIVYEVLPDGTAQVVMYEGTAKKVRIAETYQGVAVTKIGNNAFIHSDITSIVIPDSVTSIGEYAFAYCDSLTSVAIGDSVTSIGDGAFRDCDSLTSIVVPDSVTSIGAWAFDWCVSLISVVIGDGVTSIGNSAFSSCYSLTSVVIPDSVTSIGDEAFYYCGSLTSVYYKGTAEEWKTISGNNAVSFLKLYYYSESEPALNSAGTAYNGKFWKYGANGEVVVWEYKPE